MSLGPGVLEFSSGNGLVYGPTDLPTNGLTFAKHYTSPSSKGDIIKSHIKHINETITKKSHVIRKCTSKPIFLKKSKSTGAFKGHGTDP
jgi:hypothetical protein